ncbi:hypothetical protein PGIGA_G00181200, partial [Pangasianodon gigas]|nr:hypothetical protein [Pangasianodon gigas]
ADNTPWGYQALDNTNDISSQCGKVITEGNYGERWDGDFPNACPQSLQCKVSMKEGPVARMQGILPEVASSSSSSTYTHNPSIAFSADCQEIPSGITPEIKYSNCPVYQHPSTENMRAVPEDYIERIESMTSNTSVNDQLAGAQQQVLKRSNPFTWTAVIKEALEMSNGMELERNLLADMSGTPLIYDPPTESRAVEFVKNHFDPEDNESNVQEGREVTKAQEPTDIILSDETKRSPFKPNQVFQQRTVAQYMDPPTDGSSPNGKVLGETSRRILKRCSSVGLYDATEVCSLAQSKTTEEKEVSYFTKRPCLSDELGPVRSNMHEQSTNLKEHMSCGNEEGVSVLRQALQHSSHRISKERAQSCKNVSNGKCMDSQTKSCTDNNATLHRHLSIPSHHLKFDTISAEPSLVYSSTSDRKQDDLVCNLQKGNPPTPTLSSMEHFQKPVEVSRTWIESEEFNLPSKKEESTNNKSNAKCTPREPDVLTIAAHSSCKVVRKKEDGRAHMLDDTPTCSQSHSSCELSSSDTNNTSLLINTDKETDNGQVITQNIMNVGEVSDDTTAHYNSQGKSQSLTVSSNPETGVNSVFSLENTSKERKSEVNIGSPQTPTDFLEKETAQVEPYKDHSTHFAAHECKIDPDCKSPSVNLSSVSTPVTMKKRVGRAFKKRKLLKMAKVFSTIQEPSENITAHSGKFSRDLKKLKRKAEKMHSPPTYRTKSRCTAITLHKEKKLLRNSHAEIKEDR